MPPFGGIALEKADLLADVRGHEKVPGYGHEKSSLNFLRSLVESAWPPAGTSNRPRTADGGIVSARMHSVISRLILFSIEPGRARNVREWMENSGVER
jgi:hypothetical protein